VPIWWGSAWGGHDFCLVTRVGVYVYNPVDDGEDEGAEVSWDSSLVVGMTSAETSIHNRSDGTLTRSGSGANSWDNEGCLFHLNRAGVLAFACAIGSNDSTIPGTATADLEDLIEHQKAHNYPTFLDLGMRLHQDAVSPTIGWVEPWYRVVRTPRNNTHALTTPTTWTKLGDRLQGGVLPFSDWAQTQVFTLEWSQGSANTDEEDGLEIFLSYIGGFANREESNFDDATWPH